MKLSAAEGRGHLGAQQGLTDSIIKVGATGRENDYIFSLCR